MRARGCCLVNHKRQSDTLIHGLQCGPGLISKVVSALGVGSQQCSGSVDEGVEGTRWTFFIIYIYFCLIKVFYQILVAKLTDEKENSNKFFFSSRAFMFTSFCKCRVKGRCIF